MSTLLVVKQLVEQVIREGKDLLRTNRLQNTMGPVVSAQQAVNNYQSLIAQAGNQAQTRKNNNYLLMKQQKPPSCTTRDSHAAITRKIEPNLRSKTSSLQSSPRSPKRWFSSLRKDKGNSSVSGKSVSMSQVRQKQNQLVKLQQVSNRVVIQRVKQRDEQQQDSMRQTKRQKMLREYQQKISNQTFHQQRHQATSEKAKLYQQHVTVGDVAYYDQEGQLVLVKGKDNQASHRTPSQTPFKIDYPEDQQEQETVMLRSSRGRSSSASRQRKTVQDRPLVQQHHRIRSARGQAFASSVLKTINLSKISMNNTFRDGEVEYFMKRNDLFNNNHSRQTTSIPYLQPNDGTVYTQLTTNQVLSTRAQSAKNTPEDHNNNHNKRLKYLAFSKNIKNNEVRSVAYDTQREQAQQKVGSRPIRTADAAVRRTGSYLQRPKTSGYTGRITTVNEGLMMDLIE